MSLLHKLKYNKQKIIEYLLLMGSEVRFNQRVTKPWHMLFSNSFIYRTTNFNWRREFWIQSLQVKGGCDFTTLEMWQGVIKALSTGCKPG